MNQASEAPLNDLERALFDAARDPEAAERFYVELMRSELYVVGRVEGLEGVPGQRSEVEDGSMVELFWAEIDEREVLPVFSAPERLLEATGGEQPWMGLPAGLILEQGRGRAAVMLNPGVWYGKELEAEEIEDLLSGRLPGAGPGDTHLTLSALEEFPTMLGLGLVNFLAPEASVWEAYLARVQTGSEDPHVLLALDIAPGASIDDLLEGLAAVVQESYDAPVDIIVMDDGDVPRLIRDNLAPFFVRRDPGDPVLDGYLALCDMATEAARALASDDGAWAREVLERIEGHREAAASGRLAGPVTGIGFGLADLEEGGSALGEAVRALHSYWSENL